MFYHMPFMAPAAALSNSWNALRQQDGPSGGEKHNRLKWNRFDLRYAHEHPVFEDRPNLAPLRANGFP